MIDNTRIVPFHEFMDIKQFIVDINKDGKLIAKLPKDVWGLPESELKSRMKKWQVITPKDIEVEKMYYNEQYESTVFEVCIHDFFRYGFIKRKNGDVDYDQLLWKGYEVQE